MIIKTQDTQDGRKWTIEMSEGEIAHNAPMEVLMAFLHGPEEDRLKLQSKFPLLGAIINERLRIGPEKQSQPH